MVPANPPLIDPSEIGSPPVSVVIPCFRCGTTIARAVDSVASQTLVPAELILVDDGSGDGTAHVLRQLQSKYGSEWIRIIELTSNMGPSAARNAGWEVATGKYVAFLDADDAWHPEKLYRQHALMENCPDIALSGHAARRLGADETPGQLPVAEGFKGICKVALLLSNRFITPSVMLRRDLSIRFNPDRHYMEDHLLWMQIAYAGLGVARLNAELAYTFKAAFGESGLSSAMRDMHRGEIANYRQLHEEGHYGRAALVALLVYSMAKYARRLLHLRFLASEGS